MSTASGDEERSAVDGSKAPGGPATASEGSAGRRSAAWLMKKLEATKAASQAKREALRITDSAFWNGEAVRAPRERSRCVPAVAAVMRAAASHPPTTRVAV
jgi:hypothetical protein